MTWTAGLASSSAIDKVMRRDRISRRAFMRRAGRGGIALGALATIPGILAAWCPGQRQQQRRRQHRGALAELAAYIDIDRTTDRPTRASTPSRTRRGLEVEYDEGLLDNADFLAQYAPTCGPATTPAGT